jgi:4-hydroxybenzoate polyprenyltransferase
MNKLLILRPSQWLKNLFVFLPVFFEKQLGNVELLFAAIIAFCAFSLISSAIYCFNDICDVDSDRQHPVKCKRPVASGMISISVAYLIMICCIIFSLLILFVWGGESRYYQIAIIVFYFIMNILYCIKLKFYAIIDVMIVSIGFVLRIITGGIATSIYLSEWIVIMTFLLALFLAFAKRRDDVILYNKTGVLYRKNTSRYNLEFLNQVMTIIATIAMVSYIMYTISPDVVARLGSRYIYITSIFVIAGIIRYMQLSLVDENSGSPTKIFVKDRFIQSCILCWIFSLFFFIYVL